MKEITLTGTLKTYKAVVIYSGKDIPDGYISIAGGMIGDDEIEIAIPESLKAQPHLFNKLARQAQDLIMNALADELPGDLL